MVGPILGLFIPKIDGQMSQLWLLPDFRLELAHACIHNVYCSTYINSNPLNIYNQERIIKRLIKLKEYKEIAGISVQVAFDIQGERLIYIHLHTVSFLIY